jgi:hypothetical protein
MNPIHSKAVFVLIVIGHLCKRLKIDTSIVCGIMTLGGVPRLEAAYRVTDAAPGPSHPAVLLIEVYRCEVFTELESAFW